MRQAPTCGDPKARPERWGRPNPAFLVDGRGFAYVASDGETVVGFAWGSVVAQPDGGRLLLLAGLQVAEAVRSAKVGKQLLDAFAEDGRAAGLTRMWMLSDAGHRAARLLYDDAVDPGPATIDTPWWVLG
ncbi:MAG: GNAT family N-acetyltransferase [Actinomycetota bacterium]|nr:GNAT family N-acetyltransferase [Actinomycetota bacterium]